MYSILYGMSLIYPCLVPITLTLTHTMPNPPMNIHYDLFPCTEYTRKTSRSTMEKNVFRINVSRINNVFGIRTRSGLVTSPTFDALKHRTLFSILSRHDMTWVSYTSFLTGRKQTMHSCSSYYQNSIHRNAVINFFFFFFFFFFGIFWYLNQR